MIHLLLVIAVVFFSSGCSRDVECSPDESRARKARRRLQVKRSTKRTRAILVVEDNDSVAQLVKLLLESAGYAVIVAGDGDAGFAFFQQNRPAISLLLTDVEMPRMNGIDLADRVLELDGKLPILFMSGTDTPNADRGYGCVAKPFQATELIARVGAALQASSALAALSRVSRAGG